MVIPYSMQALCQAYLINYCLFLRGYVILIFPTTISFFSAHLCCGSGTFWYGSGFGSCCFRQWPSRSQQKIYRFLIFFTLFFNYKKVIKKWQIRRNQGFSYYFWLMIAGSGSGYVPLTNGSGSDIRGPKNIRILRIRISNTAAHSHTVVEVLMNIQDIRSWISSVRATWR